MLFSSIKVYIKNKQYKCHHKYFVVKSKFLNLFTKNCYTHRDFRVDDAVVIEKRRNYKFLIRVWYLVWAIRTIKISLIANRMSVFSYRRTKMFSKCQDAYDLSLNKQFYEALIEHRKVLYCLTLSVLGVDTFYLVLCLYALKRKSLKSLTVIKKTPVKANSNASFVFFVLNFKWKFKTVPFR